MFPCPYYANTFMYNADPMQNPYKMYPYPYMANIPMFNNLDVGKHLPNQYIPYMDPPKVAPIQLKDYGPEPFTVNIEEATLQNNNYRTALWTGKHLQMTLMSIPVGDDIGLEVHPHADQFIRIEEGQGIVKMGDKKDKLDFQANVQDDYAIVIPAGKWHNVINTGNKPLKLYSIYAPPQHAHGTVQKTKKDPEQPYAR